MRTRENYLEEYLSKSFLGSINLSDYTDITYNGVDFYFVSRTKNKEKMNLNITNEEVGNFLIHMANILGKNFNTLNPFLDVTFLTYRLSAVHPVIAKERKRGLYTFSLRIYQGDLVVNKYDHSYCSRDVHNLFKKIIECKQSVLISGSTGSRQDRASKISSRIYGRRYQDNLT